jgi:hypothetical protein
VTRDGVVVVGGSLAGVTAADALRRGGYDGPVTVIGAEPAYARPPLSKAVLTDSEGPDSVRLPALPADVTVQAFGLAAKLAGHLPVAGQPTVLRGSLAQRSALLHWPHPQRPVAASINVKLSVPKLRQLATAVPA